MKFCIVHPDRPATGTFNVPCAPGGKLHVCEECIRTDNVSGVFIAYQNSHAKEIKLFKTPGSPEN